MNIPDKPDFVEHSGEEDVDRDEYELDEGSEVEEMDEILTPSEAQSTRGRFISLIFGNQSRRPTSTSTLKPVVYGIGDGMEIKHAIAQDCSYHPIMWTPPSKRIKTNTPQMIQARETGQNFRRKANAKLFARFIPNHFAKTLQHYPEQLFCGSFSSNGKVFLSACQDAVIRLYHSRDLLQWSANPIQEPARPSTRRRGGLYPPPPPEGKSNANMAPKPFRQVDCRGISWSIISTDFSPDMKWIAYSSWSPYVHLANIFGDYEMHEAHDFKPETGHFCLFSIQFSPNNTHIAGGSSDRHVYMYNLERKKVVSRSCGHNDDVNAVKFLDETSNLLLSGSDDYLIKVWDTRSMTAPVGVLTGHNHGITYIDSKSDGYHLVSNSKDQTIKLWDIRRMKDNASTKGVSRDRRSNFDYRWEGPARIQVNPVKDDMSVVTFTGHSVLRTLIRCHFSPAHTTGQRYIIAGGGEGKIIIWDILDGKIVQVLDKHTETVRDVAWHPDQPFIASSSWDSTVGLWDFRREEKEMLLGRK